MTVKSVEDLTLTISQETHVRASLDSTFAALLQQMGPGMETPEGNPLPMALEAWPGGRWFRDLGESNGHFWGNVQAIKRPTLLEITGPLWVSFPFVSNLQYRLTRTNDGTLISFRHTALGFIPEENKVKIGKGWSAILERVQKQLGENA